MKKLKAILSFVFILGIMCLGFSFAFDFKTRVTAGAVLDKNEVIERIISGEYAEKGGAIYLSAGSTYNMRGGELSGHFAEKGGAIYIGDGAVFTMTGGTITGNYAKYGGAIYVASGGECYINGGTITGNFAENAPAIYVESGGILKIDTTALVDGNEFMNMTSTSINIYVDGTLSKTIIKVGESYTIDESEMPLDYESCCGYFYDERLSQCTNGVVDLTKGEGVSSFAPKTATVSTNSINIYTKTASDESLFAFTLDSETDTYKVGAHFKTSLIGDIVLPKEYNNKQTQLAGYNESGAFRECEKMTGITFQDGLTKITHYSFYRTNISGELVIPDSVTSIESYAFYNCDGLTGELIIPNSVTNIGAYSFNSCEGFTGDLVIPDSVSTLGEFAFQNCNGFDGSLIVGNGVKNINNNTFDRCGGLSGELIIPDGVTTIGNNAFYNCKGFTGTLKIPDSVTSIGNYVFYYCNNFSGNLIIGNGVKSIGEYAFFYCDKFSSLTLGSSVETIGASAFFICSAFSGSLIIPDSVKTIGASAFYKCGFTGDLIIGNGVTQIGGSAFYEMKKITGSLTLGNSLVDIGGAAFYSCYKMTGNLTIPNSVKTIGVNAFNNCFGLRGVLTLGSNIETIGAGAFQDCSGLTGNLVISSSVVTIGDKAFCDCESITGINVSSENTYYNDKNGKNAIVETSSNKLVSGFNSTDLSILQEVSSIADYAFSSCSKLTGTLNFAENLTSIGAYAFSGCFALTQIGTFGNSLTSIGNYAFHNCYNLKGNIIIPNSVTTIGQRAFYCCSALESVYMPSSVTTITASSSSYAPFHSCSKMLVIYTDVADADSIPSGWGAYWNYQSASDILTTIYGCSLDQDGNVVTSRNINIYVDGVLSKSLSVSGEKYTIVEADMPLDYESCCGYFLDDSYVTTIKNNTIDLTNGDVNLYTKTAVVPSGVTFVLSSTSDYYSLRIPYDISFTGGSLDFAPPRTALTISATTDIVMPKKYNGLPVKELNDAFNNSAGQPSYKIEITSFTLNDEVEILRKYAFSDTEMVSMCLTDKITSIETEAFFHSSSLNNIYIPRSVMSIEDYIFSYCYYITIYTDVADADSIPSGWGTYWNYIESSPKTVKYGYTTAQYKAEVGMTFASHNTEGERGDNGIEISESYMNFAGDYEQYAILNEEKEYVAFL